MDRTGQVFGLATTMLVGGACPAYKIGYTLMTYRGLLSDLGGT